MLYVLNVTAVTRITSGALYCYIAF